MLLVYWPRTDTSLQQQCSTSQASPSMPRIPRPAPHSSCEYNITNNSFFLRSEALERSIYWVYPACTCRSQFLRELVDHSRPSAVRQNMHKCVGYVFRDCSRCTRALTVTPNSRSHPAAARSCTLLRHHCCCCSQSLATCQALSTSTKR